jgi:hypothetical protein
MRKLTPFRPQVITWNFFPYDINSPEDINKGRCFVWAYLAFKVFKGVRLYRTSIHAFVKHGSRFYDSETPRGVKSSELLPIHKRHPTCIFSHEQLPAAEFRFQFPNLSGLGLSWSELDQRAKELLRQHQ